MYSININGKDLDNYNIIDNKIIGASSNGIVAYTEDDGHNWNIIINDPQLKIDAKHMKNIGNNVVVMTAIETYLLPEEETVTSTRVVLVVCTNGNSANIIRDF